MALKPNLPAPADYVIKQNHQGVIGWSVLDPAGRVLEPGLTYHQATWTRDQLRAQATQAAAAQEQTGDVGDAHAEMAEHILDHEEALADPAAGAARGVYAGMLAAEAPRPYAGANGDTIRRADRG